MHSYQKPISAGADLSNSLGFALYLDSGDSYKAKPFTSAQHASQRFYGVAAMAIEDDDSGDAVIFGPAFVKFGGAVNAGDLVTTDANGKFVAASAGDPICGFVPREDRDGAARSYANGVMAEVFVLGGELNLKMDRGTLFGTLTHNFGAIADEASASQTLAVAGAEVGDLVVVNAVALEDGLTVEGYVSAADTVTIKAKCHKAAGVDPAEQDFLVAVIKV